MSQDTQHLETFKAIAHGKGWPTSVSISDTEWTIQLDEPTDDGGKNSGANPMQHFIASLAGCQNEQAQVVASELSLAIGDIEIELEIDLDLAGFMGFSEHSNDSYEQARLHAVVHGDITKEQAQTLGEKVNNRCPILALLRSAGCDITSTWDVA